MSYFEFFSNWMTTGVHACHPVKTSGTSLKQILQQTQPRAAEHLKSYIKQECKKTVVITVTISLFCSFFYLITG